MASLSSLATISISSHHHRIHRYQTTKVPHITAPKLFYTPSLCSQPFKGHLSSPKPKSKHLLSTFFSPPHEKKGNILVPIIAPLLLGSLIFMATFKSKPLLAHPVQETESVEKKGESDSMKRSSDDEDEEEHMCVKLTESVEKKGESDSMKGSSENEDEEEHMCVKLFEGNPKDVEALKMVVNVKMKKRKTNEAVEYVEKLIELQPSEMEWRLLQALCYEMIGNLGKAKSLYKNILKQRPLLVRALHGLAMVMHKKHEGPAVFDMLGRALEVARREKKVNEERNIRILTAQMHLVTGDLGQALEKFQALIVENPRDFRPYLCQGIVYSLLDKKKEADHNFEIYRCLVPEEFPQKGFLDDVVLSARTEPKKQIEKEQQN